MCSFRASVTVSNTHAHTGQGPYQGPWPSGCQTPTELPFEVIAGFHLWTLYSQVPGATGSSVSAAKSVAQGQALWMSASL